MSTITSRGGPVSTRIATHDNALTSIDLFDALTRPDSRGATTDPFLDQCVV